MLQHSYRIILGSILSMVIASILFYLDAFSYIAYAMIVIGFFGVGIGILLGFFKMVSDDES